jgi:hypothetical protein
MPLRPQITLQVFEKWAIDFVGPTHPPKKSSRERYIITTTKYLTKWAEQHKSKTAAHRQQHTSCLNK